MSKIERAGLFKVLKKRWLTENTFCLRTERPNVKILAGQCFNVGIPGAGVNREYSMYSAADAPYLEFLIRKVDGGCVSDKLKDLEIDDVVEIDGPYGEFCIRDSMVSWHHLFLATGTGIAPFHSFSQTYPNLNYSVVHGVRFSSEQYDFMDFKNGSYIACVSRDTSNREGSRLTDYVSSNPVKSDTLVYLCGNRNMIVDCIDILRSQGVSGDNLITEVFF